MKEVVKERVEEFLEKGVRQFPYQRQTKHKASSYKAWPQETVVCCQHRYKNVEYMNVIEVKKPQALGELRKTCAKI
jgi:hypothetical protein